MRSNGKWKRIFYDRQSTSERTAMILLLALAGAVAFAVFLLYVADRFDGGQT